MAMCMRLLELVQEGNAADFTAAWRTSGLGINFAGQLHVI
jgi:hypothetical protein